MSGVSWSPMPPAAGCERGCRPLVAFDGDRLIGIKGEGGAPPCALCREESRAAFGPERLRSALRPRGGRRGGPGGLEACRPDESIDRLVMALERAARGERRFVWLSSSVNPRPEDALTERAGVMLPGARLIRRQPALARVAACAASAWPAARAQLEPEGTPLLAWELEPAGWTAGHLETLARAASRCAVVGARAHPLAAEHLSPRPGSAVALALGLAGALGCSSPEAQAWSVERCADVTGVAAEAILAFARWLAEARGGRLLLGEGVGRAGRTEHLVSALRVLAECAGLDVLAPRPAPRLRAELPPFADGVRRLDSGELAAWLDEAGAERELVFVTGGDPLLSWPGADALRQRLSRAAFVAVLAHRRTPVCELADLVLPVPASHEETGAVGLLTRGELWEGRPAVPLPRGVTPVAELWQRVARRLGWSEAWFPAELGTLGGPEAFEAPRPAALPERAEHAELGEGPIATPELHKAYPLQLRALSQGEREDRGLVATLGVAEATARGVGEGDAILVHNERGSVPATLSVDPELAQGLVEVPLRGPAETGAALLMPAGERGEEHVGGVLVEVGAQRV